MRHKAGAIPVHRQSSRGSTEELWCVDTVPQTVTVAFYLHTEERETVKQWERVTFLFVRRAIKRTRLCAQLSVPTIGRVAWDSVQILLVSYCQRSTWGSVWSVRLVFWWHSETSYHLLFVIDWTDSIWGLRQWLEWPLASCYHIIWLATSSGGISAPLVQCHGGFEYSFRLVSWNTRQTGFKQDRLLLQ